jgi:hypothetical protein
VSGLWHRLSGPLGRAWQRARYTEPAVLRARWAQALGFAAVIGVTVPGWANHYAGVALAAFAILAPWLQGKRTRSDVWSQQTVDDLADLVSLFPDQFEEAKRLLGAGLQYRIVREHLEAQSPRHAAPG